MHPNTLNTHSYYGIVWDTNTRCFGHSVKNYFWILGFWFLIIISIFGLDCTECYLLVPSNCMLLKDTYNPAKDRRYHSRKHWEYMKNNGFNKCDLISVLVLKILDVSNFSSKGIFYLLAWKYFYCHCELWYGTFSFIMRTSVRKEAYSKTGSC